MTEIDRMRSGHRQTVLPRAPTIVPETIVLRTRRIRGRRDHPRAAIDWRALQRSTVVRKQKMVPEIGRTGSGHRQTVLRSAPTTVPEAIEMRALRIWARRDHHPRRDWLEGLAAVNFCAKVKNGPGSRSNGFGSSSHRPAKRADDRPGSDRDAGAADMGAARPPPRRARLGEPRHRTVPARASN